MHSSLKLRKTFRSRLRRRAQFLALLLGAAPMAGQALGQNVYWNISTAVANNWATATNWVGTPTGGAGSVPNLTVTANFSSNAASGAGTKQIFLAGNRSALGLVFTGAGPYLLRSNSSTTTVQTLTLGSGGITVNASTTGVAFQTTAPGFTTSSGQVNTILDASQTWTNHSTGDLSWNGRIAGVEATTLTKAGTGLVTLLGNNSTTAGTISGLRGKIMINEGVLRIGQASALGIKDALTTETSSVGLAATMMSDTIIASGAALNINNISATNEFVSVSGSGVGGAGAIFNGQTGTGVNNGLQQVLLLGDTTFGGATAKWDIRGVNPGEGRLFQDGFTLTKTGGNNISLTNTEVLGGGNINVAQGILRVEGSTNIDGAGTISLQSGTTLQFTNNTGNVSRAIVTNAGSQIQSTGNDLVQNSSASVLINAATTFSVVDNNNATTVGTLNLNGMTTGTGDIIKVGSGRLGLDLQPGYTGNVTVRGGGFDLTTSGGAIASNISLDESNFAPTTSTIFRVGIGGEGQTTGTLTIGGLNTITFDPTTTGANQFLRVGAVDQSAASNVAVVRLKAPITGGTGLVVLESAANDLLGPSVPLGFVFQGRSFGNGLTWNASQVLLDYQAGNLTWRGNDGATDPTFWDIQNAMNWDNGGTADVFFDLDIVTFDDTVGAGSTLVAPQGAIASGVSINFNNNAVNYTVTPSDVDGVIQGSQSILNKSGTGTVTINTVAAGAAHNFGTLNALGGITEFGYTGAVGTTTVTSTVGQTNISSGATVRNSLNVNNSGMGAGPVNVASGGVFELTRNGISSAATITTATALTNQFSGAGDVRFNGVATTSTSALDSHGAFTINAQNSGFSGRWVLNNARISADNTSGDELGTATVVVPSGSAAAIAGATIAHEGNTFEVNGTGWAFETTFSNGGMGALRFITTGATIGATSSVVLQSNTRITGNGIDNAAGNFAPTATLGIIKAPISGGFDLELGNPSPLMNVNGSMILAGANVYTGNTLITNHTVGASNNAAFGTGTVTLNGVTTARVTQLNISNGVTISNPIVVGSIAGQGGRGQIEGAGTRQVLDDGAGVGTVSGPITLQGPLPANWGHFGSGAGLGASLNVTGSVNLASGDTIVHRSSTANGYTQFNPGTLGGGYNKFDLSGGTVRLGGNNALNSGVDLITRNVAASGRFDMSDFNHTFNSVIRGSAVTGSTFNLVNSGTGTSTLTISGGAASDIQNIPVNASGGIVNIVKNGAASLVLSGTTANLTGIGNYTINAGDFSVAAGQTAAGSLTMTGGKFIGTGTVAGASTVSGGGFAPGASPGTLGFGGNLAVSLNTFYDWEIFNAGLGGTTPPTVPSLVSGTPGTDYDQITVGGTLDLTNLINMNVNVFGLSALPNTQGVVTNFDPTMSYAWTLFATANTVTGFNASAFTIDTTAFTNNNPVTGTFSIGLLDSNTDVVLFYTAVPEPSSIMLLVTGLGMGVIRYRRRSKSNSNGLA